jgi:hypothetical protein
MPSSHIRPASTRSITNGAPNRVLVVAGAMCGSCGLFYQTADRSLGGKSPAAAATLAAPSTVKSFTLTAQPLFCHG